MRARRYEPDRDEDALMGWLSWRDREVGVEQLSKVGYIVDDLAAGFLYQTDSSVALIDCLTANPLRPAAERDAALDAVVKAIIEHARSLGFATLTGYTQLEAVRARASKLGFVEEPTPYTLVQFDLSRP